MAVAPINHYSIAVKVIKLQFLTMIILALLVVFKGWLYFWSVIIGGSIALLPNIYFTWQLFNYSGAVKSKQILLGFYLGEAGKWFLTLLLFIVVGNWVSFFSAKWLLLAFILVQSVLIWFPLWRFWSYQDKQYYAENTKSGTGIRYSREQSIT